MVWPEGLRRPDLDSSPWHFPNRLRAGALDTSLKEAALRVPPLVLALACLVTGCILAGTRAEAA